MSNICPQWPALQDNSGAWVVTKAWNTWFPCSASTSHPRAASMQLTSSSKILPYNTSKSGRARVTRPVLTLKPSTPASGHQQGHWRMPARIHKVHSQCWFCSPSKVPEGRGHKNLNHSNEIRPPKRNAWEKTQVLFTEKSLEDLEPEGEIMSTNTCHGEKAGRESPPDNCTKHEWPRLWSNTPCCQFHEFSAEPTWCSGTLKLQAPCLKSGQHWPMWTKGPSGALNLLSTFKHPNRTSTASLVFN